MTFERHVKRGDNIQVSFKGSLEDGSIFDSSLDNAPLEFQVGNNEVIQGLDEAVIGMKINQEKTIYVNPDKGYGPVERELIIVIDRKELPKNLKLVVGEEITIPNEDGKPQMVIVSKINENSVELDGNHPLAGKNLIFEIKLLGIL